MKRLNLEVSIETFAFFDTLLILMALLGFVLGAYAVMAEVEWLFFLMLAGELLLVYSIFIAPRRLKVNRYREALCQDPKHWLRVVLLTDLHAGKNKSTDWFAKIADKVSLLKPEILFLGGDFVLWNGDDMERLKPLASLKARGKYFVLGNHDYLGHPERVSETLKSWGFINIVNTGFTFLFQGSELTVFGLDDPILGKGMAPLDAQLLLAHSPDSVLDMHEGAGLVLCGHTHGGQIRLPFFGCVTIPSKLGCRVDQGFKIINGVKMIISRGLGEVGIRARLFCTPEITVVEVGIK